MTMRVTTVSCRSIFALLISALFALSFCFSGVLPAQAQVNVLTQHNDNQRTGQNLNETILTTSNVNSTTFGKLFTRTVDGEVYAQPLYVSQLSVAGQGIHNVVYVATMNNSVYAFDADDPNQSAPLWRVNLGPTVPSSDVQCCCPDIAVQVGILSTPVIDPTTNTIYALSRNKYADGTYHQWLNALDITSGAVKVPPVEIQAAYQGLTFDPKIHNQRAALTLANGNIYVAWASHNDCGPFHGWLMSYSAATLAQTGVYVDTPTGTVGGIWMSGQGLTVDAAGNVYFSSGNGTWATDGSQTGNSFVKMTPGLAVLDWFTPYNSGTLNAGDQDLGAGGLLAIPGTSYVVGGGKQGVLYLVSTGSMGHFHAGADTVQQEFQAVFGTGSSHIHGSPIYYNSPVNGPTVFVWGENDFLRAYQFNLSAGLFNTTAISTSTMTAPMTNANAAMPGGFLSLSSNNGQPGTGIVWASTPYNANANDLIVRGVVHAFDESTLRELWSDKQNDARDDIGNFAKFAPPTIAGGKVYLGNFGTVGSTAGSGQLVVYGLLPTAPSFTLTAGPSSVGVVQGAAAATKVTVTNLNGFNSPVTLSVSALPAGTAAVFGTNPATGVSTLTFTASAAAALGTSKLTLTGSANGLVKTTTLTLTVSLAPPITSVVLTPIADAYTESGASAAQNFGTSPQLLTNLSGTAAQLLADLVPPTPARYSFMKFDLSALPSNITKATLRVYGSTCGPSPTTINAFSVADSTWTEAGLTWNNMPALGPKIITQSVIATPQYYTWDVTSYLKAQQAAGVQQQTLALTLNTLPQDGVGNKFNSREAAGNIPQLALTLSSGPSYPGGFTGAGGLKLNGNAKLNGSVLRLTDAGKNEASSAFFAYPVNVQQFHTNFTFLLSSPVADGFTFCIQGVGPTALGGRGGGLGYGFVPGTTTGPSIGSSGAVKFDLFQNAAEGTNSTGFFTNGVTPTSPCISLNGTGIDLHSSDVIAVAMAYDGTTLTVTETDATTGATATQSYVVNLPALVGGATGYVGFTGGDGGQTATQDIQTWTYGQ